MDKEHQSATTRENIQKAHELWRNRQDRRRAVLAENQQARSQRSDQQQLKLLKQRPGKSLKEVARLQARIAENRT